jgi:hypothetical protein
MKVFLIPPTAPVRPGPNVDGGPLAAEPIKRGTEGREMTELWYARGTRSAAEVQREIDGFWAELDGSDELRKDVENAGIDLSALAGVDRGGAIRVSVRGAGLGPETVALVVAFAPAANVVLMSLWGEVLLPRIRGQHGRDAIRHERPPEP